jgi:abortive infection bacteriophage resistance protein
MQYPKPALSVNDQILKLASRGLIFSDKGRATALLSKVSYQRLKPYFNSFYQPGASPKKFIIGTDFNQIVSLYEFDEKLRSLVFQKLSKIEVAIRTYLVNELSVAHGPHWFLDSNLFLNDIHSFETGETRYAVLIQDIKKECNQDSDNASIKRYFLDYSNPPYPELPPSWMTFEVITFGKLSRLYKLLKNNPDRQMISSKFNLIPLYLDSWLECFSYIRNICAHHGLLWRRKLIKQPALPTRKNKKIIATSETTDSRTVYVALVCIQQILLTANIDNAFAFELKELIANAPFKLDEKMGFTSDWQSEKIWNV